MADKENKKPEVNFVYLLCKKPILYKGVAAMEKDLIVDEDCKSDKKLQNLLKFASDEMLDEDYRLFLVEPAMLKSVIKGVRDIICADAEEKIRLREMRDAKKKAKK